MTTPGQPEEASFPGEFVPAESGKNCDKAAGGWGIPMDDYEFIWYSNMDQNRYPSDACTPYYHRAAQINNLKVNTLLDGAGSISMSGNVSSNGGAHVLSNKKNIPFDMPHPNKEGWRLRHVCIEGPEIAVYCRGKVSSDGIINLPSFWEGLVNPEDMTINLTPIGCWQELFVKEIRWGRQIVVQNNAGGPINADYHIIARRLDDDLIVEYEGKTHEDYPGGNEGYSFNFEHNYVKNLIQETIREHLDKQS